MHEHLCSFCLIHVPGVLLNSQVMTFFVCVYVCASLHHSMYVMFELPSNKVVPGEFIVSNPAPSASAGGTCNP
jgi:hypothetical protein